MNFFKKIVAMVLGFFQDAITVYINSKTDKTAEWQKLLGGLMPMVFSYLEAPIMDGIENKMNGSDKFQLALTYAEKYLSKYVNVDVAQEDLLAYVQLMFDKWKYKEHKDATRTVFNGKEIRLAEVVGV